MISIRINGKQLDLLKDTEVSFEQNNPMKEDDGFAPSYTFPIDIPVTENNCRLLSFWPYASSIKSFVEIDCELNSSILTYNCKLKILKWSKSVIQIQLKTGAYILKEAMESTFIDTFDYGTFATGNTVDLAFIKFDLAYDINEIPDGYPLMMVYRQPGTTSWIFQPFVKSGSVADCIDALVSRLNTVSKPPVYNSGTTYNTGDCVRVLDSWYVSLIDSNNQPLTDSASWFDVDANGYTLAYQDFELFMYDEPRKVAGRILASRRGEALIIHNTSAEYWDKVAPIIPGIPSSGQRVLYYDLLIPDRAPFNEFNPTPFYFAVEGFYRSRIQQELEESREQLVMNWLAPDVDSRLSSLLPSFALPMYRNYQSTGDRFDSDIINSQDQYGFVLDERFNGWSPQVRLQTVLTKIAESLGLQLQQDITGSKYDGLVLVSTTVDKPNNFEARTLDLVRCTPHISVYELLKLLRQIGIATFFDNDLTKMIVRPMDDVIQKVQPVDYSMIRQVSDESYMASKSGYKIIYAQDESDSLVANAQASDFPEVLESISGLPNKQTAETTPVVLAVTNEVIGTKETNDCGTATYPHMVLGKPYSSVTVEDGQVKFEPNGQPIVSERYTPLHRSSSLAVTEANLTGVVYNALVHDGLIYLTGDFSVEGVDNTYRGVARMHANGTLDETFLPLFNDGIVYALAFQPDGMILIGGSFTQVNDGTGNFVAIRHGIVRVNQFGKVDQSFKIGGYDSFWQEISQRRTITAIACNNNGFFYVASFSASNIFINEVDYKTQSCSPNRYFAVDGNCTVLTISKNERATFIYASGDFSNAYYNDAGMPTTARVVTNKKLFRFDEALAVDNDFYSNHPAIGASKAAQIRAIDKEVLIIGGSSQHVYRIKPDDTEDAYLTSWLNAAGPKPLGTEKVLDATIIGSALVVVGSFVQVKPSTVVNGIAVYDYKPQTPFTFGLSSGALNSAGAAAILRWVVNNQSRIITGGDNLHQIDGRFASAKMAMVSLSKPHSRGEFKFTLDTNSFWMGSLSKPLTMPQGGNRMSDLVRFGLTRQIESGEIILDDKNEQASFNLVYSNSIANTLISKTLGMLQNDERTELFLMMTAEDLKNLDFSKPILVDGVKYFLNYIKFKLPISGPCLLNGSRTPL